MDYFLAYYQLYYWRARTSYDLSEEVDVFREITQIIHDTFATVNPNLKLCKSLEEAEKAVKTGEEEIMKTIKSKAPQLLQAIGLGGSGDSNTDGLQTIMEEDDTETSNNIESIVNEIEKDVNEANESLDESGSDFEDVEENDLNYVVGEDDSETGEDEDSVEEHEDVEELMDTDDEDSERKELEREMDQWSVKSKPKLIGKIQILSSNEQYK